MVADAFDDGADAAVADAEAFTGRAVDVSFAAGRAVEGDVADDDVVFRREDRFPRGDTMILPPDRPLPR